METVWVRKLEVDKIESIDGSSGYDPPNGWHSISEEELSVSNFNNELPTFIEVRHFFWNRDYHPYDRMNIRATLYWFADKTGVAFHKEWVYNPTKKEGQWKLMYFAFGCKHQYKELSRDECQARRIFHYGNCWHVHECQLCKYVNSYDSSD